MRKSKEFYRGCLLGGAIGDALGWPVEFKKMKDITAQFGSNGITDLVAGKNGLAEITDDTQMTIFTAEGLLRAISRGNHKGICHSPSVVHFAYLRWLYTQGELPDFKDHWNNIGWIKNVKELYVRRGSGTTCINALKSGEMGTIEKPINTSKGCGGVMRIAPVGLVSDKNRAFRLACECAALTHGHPSGYLSAGFLAHMIACIIEGMEMEDAIHEGIKEIKSYEGHEECLRAIHNAIELSITTKAPASSIPLLGEGWTGEEALSIAIYCALKFKKDYRKAVIAAVNHSGDSDSTGAITGNILGVYLGTEGIPSDWIKKVELADVLKQLADDLLIKFKETDEWWERYPGA